MSLREWWIVGWSTVRVLQNSNRIEDIHRVEEITSRGRFAALLRGWRERGDELELLDEQPELDPEHMDLEAMRALPETTLGGAYVRYLDRYQLEIFVDPTPPDHVADPEVRDLIHRYRQVHDIWHVLLGLGTRGHEEVLVHAFVLGHLGLPVSALIVLLGSIKHLVLEARWTALRHALGEAFVSGRRAAPLLMVRWEELWTEPLTEVRRRYCVQPCTPSFVG